MTKKKKEGKKPFPVEKPSPVLIIVGGEWLRFDVNERSLYVNEWIWMRYCRDEAACD